MADRWSYTHGGSPKGPVTHAQLQQLAATGKILPTDLVWPEGGDPRRAVPASSILPASAFRQTGPGPNWSGKVAKALSSGSAAGKAMPDWVSDVDEPAVAIPLPPEQGAAVPVVEVALLAQAVPQALPVGQENLPVATVVGAPVVPPVSRFVPYPPRLVFGSASSRGRVKDRNEDRFQTRHWTWNDADAMHEVALVVVVDGSGDNQTGQAASTIAARTMTAQLDALIAKALGGSLPDAAAVKASIDQAIREANRVVFQQATTVERCKGMSATAAIVVVWDGRAHVGHVGDCRVYLHRGNELKPLNSAPASQPADTHAIGKQANLEPAHSEQALSRGDYLLVACGGLTAHLDVPTIQQVLNWPAVPVHHLATQLVAMADERGGKDNCTVVIGHFA
jgi:serine/threonine protein phosphatase PrpC